MATYLLTWNPYKWHWEILDEISAKSKNGETVLDEWSCGNTKKIQSGDRFFLMKLGKERDNRENQKGIMASGSIISNVYDREHWDIEERKLGKRVLSVDIRYDILLNPYNEEILSFEVLPKEMNWFPQASGVEIKEEITKQIEELWAKFLDSGIEIPEEIEKSESLNIFEGAKKTIQVNAYERNPVARRICIEKYSSKCSVCNFNFNKVYGEEIAENFIHVHHLKPLHEIGEKYKVNPIEDLRPVCPNCHAMIHKKNPPYSIEEIKEFIENQNL